MAKGPGARPALKAGTVVPLLLTVALVERIGWLVLRPDTGAAGGEAFAVARAVAAGRGVADAYQPGQGPTAHLLPVSPAIAGGVYALVGAGNAGQLLLSIWSIACALGSYALLFRAFGRLGVATGARLVALGALAVLPTYLTQEAVDFRAWEGGLTMLVAAAFVDRLVRFDREAWDWREVAVLAALAAVGFFVNPVEGLALYAAAALALLRRRRLGQAIGAGALAAALLAALLVPWTLRNERALGSPVVLRSNAGLELALADRPDAVDGRDAAARYVARLNTIHPHSSLVAYRAMQQAGGEVAYSRRLGDATRAWLLAHPGDALRLAARHVRELLFPPAWAFKLVGTDGFARLRAGLAGAAMLLCLLALADRLRRTGGGWWYPALMVIVPALATAPFQPIARYCYLVWAVSVFCAADGAARAVAAVRGRRSAPAQPLPQEA